MSYNYPRFALRVAQKGEGWRQHVYGQHGVDDRISGDAELRRVHRFAHEQVGEQGHTHNWANGIWRDP